MYWVWHAKVFSDNGRCIDYDSYNNIIILTMS